MEVEAFLGVKKFSMEHSLFLDAVATELVK